MSDVGCDQWDERSKQPRPQRYQHYIGGTIVVVGIPRKCNSARTGPCGIGVDGAVGVFEELQLIPRFAILLDRENTDQ